MNFSGIYAELCEVRITSGLPSTIQCVLEGLVEVEKACSMPADTHSAF